MENNIVLCQSSSNINLSVSNNAKTINDIERDSESIEVS